MSSICTTFTECRLHLNNKNKRETSSLLFCIVFDLHYLCGMKQNIKINHLILMLVVCGGIYALTGSFLMTLGIVILLLVVDALLAQYERKKKSEEI